MKKRTQIIMHTMHSLIGLDTNLDIKKINKILKESLTEEDFFCKKSRYLLNNLGFEKKEVLMLLAQYKSRFKYGYNLSKTTLSHILHLAYENENSHPLKEMCKSPFFLVKACWLYEHAPYFFFYNENSLKGLDTFIIKFARQYDSLFLKNNIPISSLKKIYSPKRVMASNFWENRIFDPICIIKKVIEENIEGFELCVDFQPFNFTKLLPEEFNRKKREQIRQACKKSGIKIDIHSPIVGPYSPSPNPNVGTQLFFDPLKCFKLQCETIDLARDIGAGSVVVHLIDTDKIKKMADLVMYAAGSEVRVTIENYCMLKELQNSNIFIACVDEILKALPPEVIRKNFGITLDVGHLNIEGEDPLVASEKIGRWCNDKNIFMRIHATDNYGRLLSNPPAYSADIHSNVSGRGINNSAIIKLLRSMGHELDVVAEQIQPLTPEDISTIHEAQSCPIEEKYETLMCKGKQRLSAIGKEDLVIPDVMEKGAYLFLTGLNGSGALREHLIYRKIQERKYLTVDDAKNVSKDFMKMPQKFRIDLINYMDDLLLPIQSENGVIKKCELDLICQNISGALFATLNNEHLHQIFSESKVYNRGDIICRQNTIGRKMFFLKNGMADVHIKGVHVASLNPGEIFGEISLFYNVKRSATIKAGKDKTEVGILTREGFENLLKTSRPYAYALIYRLYNILPERLRNLNDKYKTAINSLQNILCKSTDQIPHMVDIYSKIKLKADLIPTISQDVKKVSRDIKVYDVNQEILSEKDKGDGAYLILEGRAKAVAFYSDNTEIILGELGKNEIFGEMALIDEEPRSASIVAISPCKVAFISRDTFRELIESNSDLAFRFKSFICLSLFKRILNLDKIYADVKKAFD